MRTRAAGLGTLVFVALLVVALYYLAYRYPFQINSSTTSPTYSDTPPLLQLGKYALIAVILVAGLVVVVTRGDARWRRSWRDARQDQRVVMVGMGIVSALLLARGAAVGPLDIVVVSLTLAVLPALGLILLASPISPRSIWRTLVWFAGVALVVELAQIILFAILGRLPALAYEGSLSVRFGSLWDDPNGFALVVSLLVPLLLLGPGPRWVRYAAVGGLSVSLVLTQSLTGYAAVIVGLGVVMARLTTWTRRRLLVLAIICATGVTIIVAALTTPIVDAFVASKLGSVLDHLDSFAQFPTFDVATWIGVSGSARTGIESGYVWLIANSGLPITLAYVGVGVFAVARLLWRADTGHAYRKAVDAGFAAFIVAYLVANTNLQLVSSFPLDLLYVLGIAVAIFSRAPGGAAAEFNREFASPRAGGGAGG